MEAVATPASTTRARIVEAAVKLLSEGGREAVSTRAVSAAAGVQAPTIYRLFGDKQGLLNEVAAHGFRTYLGSKTELQATSDPVDDLRAGWDRHVGFGLENPDLFSLMYGGRRPSDPPPAAVTEGLEILGGLIHRIAEAGRLRVSEERAANLVHAAGSGTTMTLISMPAQQRDSGLSELAREAVVAAITTDAPSPADPGPAGAAVTLRALLPQITVLSPHELGLLEEWLGRISSGGSAFGPSG